MCAYFEWGNTIEFLSRGMVILFAIFFFGFKTENLSVTICYYVTIIYIITIVLLSSSRDVE
jgi:hypothetical protein